MCDRAATETDVDLRKKAEAEIHVKDLDVRTTAQPLQPTPSWLRVIPRIHWDVADRTTPTTTTREAHLIVQTSDQMVAGHHVMVALRGRNAQQVLNRRHQMMKVTGAVDRTRARRRIIAVDVGVVMGVAATTHVVQRPQQTRRFPATRTKLPRTR